MNLPNSWRARAVLRRRRRWTGSVPCTSWRFASVCGVGSFWALRWDDVTRISCRACDGEGGETDGPDLGACSGQEVRRRTRSGATLQRLGGGESCGSSRPRVRTRSKPSAAGVLRRSLAKHRARQSWTSARTPGRTGRNTGSSSRHTSGRRWSRTTCVGTGGRVREVAELDGGPLP